MNEEKSLYEYKLGETCDKDLLNGIIKAPSKLVKVAFTFQDNRGNQMEAAVKHEDYIENEDDE